jgi:hypothetical protein
MKCIGSPGGMLIMPGPIIIIGGGIGLGIIAWWNANPSLASRSFASRSFASRPSFSFFAAAIASATAFFALYCFGGGGGASSGGSGGGPTGAAGSTGGGGTGGGGGIGMPSPNGGRFIGALIAWCGIPGTPGIPGIPGMPGGRPWPWLWPANPRGDEWGMASGWRGCGQSRERWPGWRQL